MRACLTRGFSLDCRFLVAAFCVAFVVSTPALSQSVQPASRSFGAKGIYAAVKDSVVVIEVRSKTGSIIQGSGVVFDHVLGSDQSPASSWVASNAHLFSDVDAIVVRQGSNKASGRVVYLDDALDLAILRVDSIVFTKATLDFKSNRVVGETVFAVGAPLGLEQTISQGIVSSLRIIDGVTLVQFTAPISPGNSGGGLFDDKAKLIGITTFKVRGGENINFALDIKHMVDIGEVLYASDLLRVLPKTNYARNKQLFSPDDIDRINSSRLTKWLLSSTSAGDAKVWRTVLAFNDEFRKSASAPVEKAERFFGQLERILVRFLMDTSAESVVRAAPSGLSVVTLNCSQISRDGRDLGEISIQIDYGNSTVMGAPATFTESEVRFSFGREIQAVLNRFTGSIRMGTQTSPSFVTGTCSKAVESQRKF